VFVGTDGDGAAILGLQRWHLRVFVDP